MRFTKQSMRIIDLSVPINEETPVYPGDPRPRISPAGILEKDGYTDHIISFGIHLGTHIDAPMHMIEGGAGLKDIPVGQFTGRGRYIRVANEFSLEDVKVAGIQAGDIVLFDTGMGERYNEADYFVKFPAMSEEVADYLVEQKVKMVGLDTGSADNQEGFPIHKVLLGGGVLIIENLTNLRSLSGKEFIVYALPIRLEIDGAPARVIAQIS